MAGRGLQKRQCQTALTGTLQMWLLQTDQPQALGEATAGAAAKPCSEPKNELDAAENMAYNPIFESGDSKETRAPEKDMVLLCCRISPVIRDSASITAVPFHVTWWRDYTGNGCQKWSVNFFLPFVLIIFCSVTCVGEPILFFSHPQ